MGGFCSLQPRVMEKKKRQQHKGNETVFPLRGVQLTIKKKKKNPPPNGLDLEKGIFKEG